MTNEEIAASVNDLNNARQIAREIQARIEQDRIPGTEGLYMTADGAAALSRHAVSIESLCAGVVARMKEST